MRKIYQLCLVTLLLISRIANAANINLQINGLFGALERNVRTQLSNIQNDEIKLDKNFRLRVDNTIRRALKALGYYKPTIYFDICSSLTGRNQILVVHVNPGKPICIGGINVILRGEAHTDQDYLNLLNSIPTVGTVLNHKSYDDFKKSLINLALRKGYFDSHFNKSQLGIALAIYQAFWNIDYDSGQRYRFGAINFEGSQIRDEYLQNLVPFKKMDYFESKELAELSRRLSATGWFNSVIISPEFDKSYRHKVLLLHGVVSPSIKNNIETGVGYSTDVGPHLKVLWKRPWMNSYGHNLTTNLSISTSEQKFNLSYKIPLLNNPLEEYYLIQNEFKRIYLNNTENDSTTLILSRYWDLSNVWQHAFSLHWNLNHFTQANVANTTVLFYSGIVISRNCLRGGLIPTWGNFQRYSINYSNTSWGSDVNFLVVQAQYIWIRTFYDNYRLIIRNNFGWIKTGDLDRVPTDMRFFAGGDRSIRGYDYKSIAPKDNHGNLIGASKLLISSLEYQYNITGKWWLAIFLDSGEAVINIHHSNFRSGAGFGVRWESPIGPIKLDLATPIGKKEECNVRFHINLGPEL